LPSRRWRSAASTSSTPPDAPPGRALATPFGTFYSPNITSHPQHGIGAWSADDLWRALTLGEGPGGVHYYPVFPYPSYAAMRREDSDALHAYLMTVPPQAVPNREHDLPWYLRWRFAARVWKWLFLDTATFRAREDKPPAWNRGAYLVSALGHCGECHTPRNLAGALARERHLAGNPQGPEGDAVPAIRSDIDDGIESWSESEIATYLKSGEDPDFDFAGGAMVDVIEENTGRLTDEDRGAIATYLKDLPAL
jgi:mono/diheme cytochrome c family protein